MEFKDQAKKILEVFNVEKYEDLPKQLMTIVLENNPNTYENYLEVIEAPNTDYIQRIYQYYLSDREELKQDFTPPSLAKLVNELSNHKEEKTIYDVCAGTGSLTLQKNHTKKFILHELNTETISSLLFNLALHNIEAVVINGDVITGENKEIYKLTKTDKFSKVSIDNDYEITDYDTVISNPPFNLNYKCKIRFKDLYYKDNNKNYAFVFKGLEKLKNNGKAVYILPNGVLTSEIEEQYRRYLIEKKLLKAVVTVPGSMFESTSIPVCLLVLSKEPNENVSFVSVSECDDKITIHKRGTRGKSGSKAHENRIYTKELNSLSNEQITDIKNSIETESDIAGFCKTVPYSKVINQDYSLSPNRYIEFLYTETHREFDEIIDEYNWVTNEMNKIKVVLNLTQAKKYGWDVYAENQKKRNKNIDQINETAHLYSDKKLLNETWITITRSAKNSIHNTDPKELTKSFETSLQNAQIMINYFDSLQNKLLAELRDALLPKFMSGEIDVSDNNIYPEIHEKEIVEEIKPVKKDTAQTSLF